MINLRKKKNLQEGFGKSYAYIAKCIKQLALKCVRHSLPLHKDSQDKEGGIRRSGEK